MKLSAFFGLLVGLISPGASRPAERLVARTDTASALAIKWAPGELGRGPALVPANASLGFERAGGPRDNCEDYWRVEDEVCAQQCFDGLVGWCPLSLIISAGKLTKGTCADNGYTQPDGDSGPIKLGPCITLTFHQFTR